MNVTSSSSYDKRIRTNLLGSPTSLHTSEWASPSCGSTEAPYTACVLQITSRIGTTDTTTTTPTFMMSAKRISPRSSSATRSFTCTQSWCPKRWIQRRRTRRAQMLGIWARICSGIYWKDGRIGSRAVNLGERDLLIPHCEMERGTLCSCSLISSGVTIGSGWDVSVALEVYCWRYCCCLRKKALSGGLRMFITRWYLCSL